MPEQAALSELVLSSRFKRCQRALAQWLEQAPTAHVSVIAARRALPSLSGSEWTRLMSWLDALLYAARENHNMAMIARIERLAASLGRSIPLHPADPAPAAALALTGMAVPGSA